MIKYISNALTPQEVIAFQKRMNWTVDPIEMWEKALKHTVYSVVVKNDDEVIGMGRILGDESIYWYINDVFILSEYQGQGIGKAIMENLLTYIQENGITGTDVSVCVMCAKGKEGFYEKLGFVSRPHAYEGAGMELEMRID